MFLLDPSGIIYITRSLLVCKFPTMAPIPHQIYITLYSKCVNFKQEGFRTTSQPPVKLFHKIERGWTGLCFSTSHDGTLPYRTSVHDENFITCVWFSPWIHQENLWNVDFGFIFSFSYFHFLLQFDQIPPKLRHYFSWSNCIVENNCSLTNIICSFPIICPKFKLHFITKGISYFFTYQNNVTIYIMLANRFKPIFKIKLIFRSASLLLCKYILSTKNVSVEWIEKFPARRKLCKL